jgi:hypothetical protein
VSLKFIAGPSHSSFLFRGCIKETPFLSINKQENDSKNREKTKTDTREKEKKNQILLWFSVQEIRE